MSHGHAIVLGFAAFSGTGKTTLLKRLIPLLKENGLRVGLIKKSHHEFEIDIPGKDSHELRKAGASPVMLSSSRRRAVITEFEGDKERSLSEELSHFDLASVDIILVEGYKQERFPKIELHRPSLCKPLLFPEDPSIIAIATDGILPVAPAIPQIDINSPRQIAGFILNQFFPMKPSDDRCAEAPKSLSLDEALARIRAAITPIEDIESVSLRQAHGRILAEDIDAPFDLPPFPASAMDGYALRHEDIADHAVAKLTVIGTSFAGKPYAGTVKSGHCVRIFTGAGMPEGADTVAMQEDAIRERDYIRLGRAVSPLANVRPAGDEIRSGERLLNRGKRLGAAELGLLASAGFPAAPVTRRLRVAFFSTGDELRSLGEPLDFGQIHDSNRYLLHGLLSDPAIETFDLGVIRDDPERVREALLEASRQADAIITSGGVSVGDADFVTESLAEVGQIDFWKVAVKPGKPFAFGHIGPARFFGLPGNPVAVMVTFRQIVRPALMQMMGADATPPLRLKAASRSVLRKAPGRMEFQRGVFGPDGAGGLAVSGCAGQGSHQLVGMSRANCFIVLPEDNAGVKPGDTVEIEPFMNGFS